MRPTREQILQSVRAIVKPLARPGGAALTDAQIIPANDKGPRPPQPYLTVTLLSASVPVGTDAAPPRAAARVTVNTKATGYVYQLTVGALTISHTRLLADTNATVAAALVAAANAASEYTYAAVLAADTTTFWLFDALARTLATAGDGGLTITAAAETVYFPNGPRSMTVELQGFGYTTEDWLNDVQLGLSSPSALQAMLDEGLTLRTLSGVAPLPTLLDTSFEGRFSLDLIGSYSAWSTPILATTVDTISFEGTLQTEPATDDEPADPLILNFDLEL